MVFWIVIFVSVFKIVFFEFVYVRLIKVKVYVIEFL